MVDLVIVVYWGAAAESSLVYLRFCKPSIVITLNIAQFISSIKFPSQSLWPRGLTCGFASYRWLRLWVRFPQGAWLSVPCECCSFSRSVLSLGPITRLGDSYQV